MTPEARRKKWLRLKARYERKAATRMRKAFRQAINIPYENLSEYTYKGSIALNIHKEPIEIAFTDIYLSVGLDYANRIGKEINNLKQFNPFTFNEAYAQFIRQWLLNEGGSKIVSIQNELIQYLIRFVGLKIEEGMDIRQIARQLDRHLRSRSFYRWQVERIVRTETTAAANKAAIEAAKSSNILMEKEWISAQDLRTRRRPESFYDHVNMHLEKVALNDMFNVNGDLLEYPGDPRGQAGNVINCRCTVAVVPVRIDGRLVRL